jgi:hypothetical protein
VTARWFASIRLVAALLIVVGLLVSVPPSFGAAEGDHFGLLLHPLLPHAHGSAMSAPTPGDRTSLRDNARALTAVSTSTAVTQAPVIRGQVADGGFRSALSGIVLPTFLAGVLLHLRQIKTAGVWLAHQDWRGPSVPPPRLLVPVVVMY